MEISHPLQTDSIHSVSLFWQDLLSPTLNNLIELSTNEVHLWYCQIPQIPQTPQVSQISAAFEVPHIPDLNEHPFQLLNLLEKTLSPDEINRLNRFKFQKDKASYILGRGGIRHILSRYLHVKPHALAFDYGEFGKPYLKNKDFSLQFNISHSGSHIVYAIANNNDVGVDIECCRADLDFLSVAREFCSSQELSKLSQLRSRELISAFYRCWTLKEAFVKAIGLGLHFPIKEIEMDFLSNTKNFIAWEKDLWKIEEIFAFSNQEIMAAIAMPAEASVSTNYYLNFL